MAISTVSDISSSLLSQLGSVQATTSATGVLNIIQTARRAYEERNANRDKINTQLDTLQEFNARISTLKDYAGELNPTDRVINVFNGNYTDAQIESSIEDFVSAYNDARSYAADNAEYFREDINASFGSFTNRAKLDLADVGIKVNTDGTLSINSDTLQDAIANDASAVQDALGGVNGLANRIDRYATTLQSTASYNLLSNVEVPERPSFAVDLLGLELFTQSTISLFA